MMLKNISYTKVHILQQESDSMAGLQFPPITYLWKYCSWYITVAIHFLLSMVAVFVIHQSPKYLRLGPSGEKPCPSVLCVIK